MAYWEGWLGGVQRREVCLGDLEDVGVQLIPEVWASGSISHIQLNTRTP